MQFMANAQVPRGEAWGAMFTRFYALELEQCVLGVGAVPVRPGKNFL